MAAKVIWLREALADLEDIGSYIERNSSNYARIVVQRLYRTAIVLAVIHGARLLPDVIRDRGR